MAVSSFGFEAWVYLSLAMLLVAGAADAQSRPTRATPEAWFERMDKDHDRQLSLEEFKAGLAPRSQAVVYQRLPAQFRALDKDQSGYLEGAEFAAAPISRPAGGVAPTLASADSSKDQRLDFREYVALVARLAATAR